MANRINPTGTRGRLLRGAAVLALGWSLAGAAAAQDLALIVDNGGRDLDPAMELLGEVFEARGYELAEVSGASRAEMAEALSETAARVTGADRLILVFVGEVRSHGGRTWLMPEGYDGQGWLDAALAGVPLDVFTDLAALMPGRAAVVVGNTPPDPEAEAPATEGFAVSAGVGAPEVPQGVLLIHGRAPQAAAVVRNGLLAPDRSTADALSTVPGNVKVRGLVSPDAHFAGALDEPRRIRITPPPTAPVTVRPEPQTQTQTRERPAEAAEAALSLDRAERREIQQQLTVLGYSTRGIDGIFGPGTRGAIGEWQAAQNLETTGFLDRAQLDRLAGQADARSAELAAEAERATRREEAADAEFWRTTGAGGSAADLRTYLDRYPDGLYAAEARAELDRLEATARSQAQSEDRAAWERAEGENTIGGYRSYLQAFPQGAFAGQAEARVAELTREPERARADEAAATAEDQLGLGQGSKALIEGQLASLGYPTGEADGTFDRDTRRALRQFQTRQGLEVTGYVNQETVQALIVASLGLR